ncbi:hypothetical protein NP493_243g01054 [Ridgeia piscesae]|uniref:Hyaluronan-mediated motility receptor C-terminal domain-containing protein n=1 Tax=Ridgeia piscesae TaxID=27915 RepID=A0AAD9NZB7_RIDPI|nr:hypothetical protein NP493_243g01054 [Ridgeia piscesae]
MTLTLTAIHARHESVITDLRRSFEETTVSRQTLEATQHDMDRWRKMYEALWEKVLPFQEQLEAFEAEKQALLGRTHNAQHEIDKLSREYARLLGHQNQKQKIRHVLKLKEENNALKQQVCSLQDQTRRQQQKLSKLEAKLQSADGASSSTSKRHFDVTKAFKHTKENVVRSPLREGRESNS